jgi:hypothetical protein
MGDVNNIMVKRDFGQQPITDEEVLHCRWYAVLDDTIGGWAISNVNKTVADLNPYEGMFEFGSFLTFNEADHIVSLHNAWWDEIVDDSYRDNFFATWNREIDEYYQTELERKPFDSNPTL